jgi:hypothetical protein
MPRLDAEDGVPGHIAHTSQTEDDDAGGSEAVTNRERPGALAARGARGGSASRATLRRRGSRSKTPRATA